MGKSDAEAGLTAWVVVLGDFGRSPRMQYHTLSLSQQPNTRVQVVAYGGSRPLEELTGAANVQINTIGEPAAWMRKLPRLLFLVFKVLQQVLQLLWLMLVVLPRPHSILLQSPPAIPTMALCWLAARRHGARLIIDWHNFGYTIMALTMRPGHWLVRLALKYEKFWGRRGDGAFCVTHAMQQELKANWGVHAVTLYDRPPAWFQRTDAAAAHDLFTRLAPSLQDPQCTDCLSAWQEQQQGKQGAGKASSQTLFTQAAGAGAGGGSGAQWLADRPAIVVSSTSWTPDEDFGILLEAATLYDAKAKEAAAAAGAGAGGSSARLPKVVFLITGKGPQKEAYLARIRAARFSHVAFRTLWLEPQDYPRLLGAADVGVSLHTSSSGLDLPMKVVDMFGAGLPVCAASYSCIQELVSPGETGLLFSSPAELSQQLQELLAGFPAAPSATLRRLQEGVRVKEQGLRWKENWEAVAWPVIKGKRS